MTKKKKIKEKKISVIKGFQTPGPAWNGPLFVTTKQYLSMFSRYHITGKLNSR